MFVEIGNVAAHEAHTETVDASTLTRDDLVARAEDAGVDTSGTKEEIAARLSAVKSFTPLEGGRVTYINIPEGVSFAEAFATVTAAGGVADTHIQPCSECGGSGSDASDDPGCTQCAGTRVQSPAWVWSDNATLEAALAEHFGCDAGRPKNHDFVRDVHFEAHMYTEGDTASGSGSVGTVASDEAPYRRARQRRELLLAGACHEHYRRHQLGIAHLRVDAGKDFQAKVMGDTASNGTGSYAAANYIALTEDATAPAAGDTALAGELVVGSSAGLQRAQATYAHTAGAANYTLTKTFTLTGATARTIQKIGVLNASSTGTLVFETALTNPPTLQTNDQLTITETVSI